MSRKRSKKPSPSSSSATTNNNNPQQHPSAASSTTSVTSQATTTTHRDDASAAGSTMSRSAASALESTASVVHKVKTQVPETLHAVAQTLPQRLPANLSRLTSSKATASTQVAQETAARTASFSAPSRPPRSPSQPRKSVSSPMSKVLSQPKPTIQLTNAPETSTSDSQSQEPGASTSTGNEEQQKSLVNGNNDTGKSKDLPKNDTAQNAADAVEPKTTSSYWLSWWGTGQPNPPSTNSTETPIPKPQDTPPSPEPIMPNLPPTLPTIDNIKNRTLQKVRSAETLNLRKNLNGSTASIRTAPPTFIDPPKKIDTPVENPLLTTDTLPAPSTSAPTSQRSSWFGYWYGATEQPPNRPDDNINGTAEVNGSKATQLTNTEGQQGNGNAGQSQEQASTPPAVPEDPKPDDAAKPVSSDGILARGAAWVWWSKSQPQAEVGNKIVETGEIAVAGSSTETDPQRAKLTTQSPQPGQKRARSGSPNSMRNGSEQASTAQPPSIPIAPKEVSPAAKTLQKVLPPNLLVPSFDSCFNPQQAKSWFALPSSVNRLWSTPKAPSKTQLSIVPTLPRIRKAVAIGVHGFFPMKLVQRVLGEPTGTSVRFATEGAAAIQRWADKHDISVDIEKIALEGEGRVSDRVEVLWKLLENRLDVIQTADFILVCCHSQGTPVGVHLVARMIEYGLVERTKIGIIGMAGINLGPFVELNSRILTGSAKELFDFSSPTSEVSQQYIESLSAVLAHGVKLVFVGSIDDQLVSLYSSTFSNINHPFIYRAVFVDGRVHAPDFISHVVGLALKLRNIGVRDHGIIRELSGPLAGSLYSGEGHSRIYDDSAIYDLGVRHSLETTTKEFLRVPLKVEDFELPSATNPYILPWAMRGMLEERRVRDENELQEESRTLLEEFAKWHPTSKVLKDVKFRLEAIRSRL
ncbi:hypothetical protein TWF694_002380 [Orbilia ellipsospora]|uniref:YMC020W-like alpha/beta hydrolase domain-containing protein n=1 Tax=Orbilia ellipsospora TaxID=2528407 RepID=A0AAV9X7Y4_9PEZI